MSDSSVTHPSKDNLFLKLAIIAACAALSCASAYAVSLGIAGELLGRPSDRTAGFCFLYRLVLACLLVWISGPASCRPVFTRSFRVIVFHSLPAVLVVWCVVAVGGFRVVTWIWSPWKFGQDLELLRLPPSLERKLELGGEDFLRTIQLRGDPDLVQDSLVLLSGCLTFLVWHLMWRRPVAAENG